MEYKILGTFTKSKGFIYRTNTYIQFGDSEEIIGSCVLCNPGSSRLEDMEEQRRLEEYEEKDNYVVTGELKSDPTMKQLIKILMGTKSIEKNGKFLIYNLFTLRNPKMEDAIKAFSQSNINLKLLYKDFEDYKSLKSILPWILIGWGCKDNPSLNKTKREWANYITDNNLKHNGYDHYQSPHYYHPLPNLVSKRIEYVEHIIPKLDKLATLALI